MSSSPPDLLDCLANQPGGRAALGRAMLRALQVFTEQMDSPDKKVAMQAAAEVARLTHACLRHGQGFALDWADDDTAEAHRPEPARPEPQPQPEPPLDVPPAAAGDLTVEEWAEFTQFARSMGFDEGAIDLARRSLDIPDAPAKTRPAAHARDRPRPSTRRESEVARLPAGELR